MYLSKLALHGFKSFAERTTLQFDPGITAVVGPNGCGKSNIVDAVRWAIGEQRARVLRSEKMENVIFNGTSKRRPLGMAEVMLTIENTRGVLPTEYAEVTIGRRLYRSGESEYLLNGVPCRLKDVLDLFMDTGMGAGAYSVIELKMIEEILSENAQDQRRLFEEAAGITKYKLRRAQTLRKLDQTQADLIRLRDLTEEIAKTVRSLKRQAEKAVRYQAYETRLHDLELILAQAEYDRLRRQAEALQAERQKLQEEMETHTARLSHDDAQLEALRKRLIDREQALAQRQRALNEHLESVRALEAERRLEQERVEAAGRDRDRSLREQAAAAVRRDEMERTLRRLAAAIDATAPVLERTRRDQQAAEAARSHTRRAAAERQEALQAARRLEQQASDAQAEHRRALDRLTSRLELLEQDRLRLADQKGTLEHGVADLNARAEASARRLDAARAAACRAGDALVDAEQRRETHRAALEEAAEALRQVERRREALAAEVQLLEALVASYEDFPDAVQFLAADPNWLGGTLLTVADVLTCDAENRAALNAALGEFNTCVLVQTYFEAQQAVVRLRSEGNGQATFIIQERLKLPAPPPEGAPAGSQAARPILEIVRVSDPAYEPMANLLLRDCYLVETLQDARTLAQRATVPARYVTRTGEWVDARGILHGGSQHTPPSPFASRLGRREQLDEARRGLETLEAELVRRREAVAEQQTALGAVPYDACRQARIRAEQAANEAEKDHARLSYEQETAARRQAELDTRLAAVQADLEAGRVEIDALQAHTADAEAALMARRTERSTAEEAFQAAELESRAALARFSEASVAAVQAQNELDNLHRDHERTQQELGELATRTAEREAHLQTLAQTLATSQQQEASLVAQIARTHEAREGLEKATGQANTALLETRSDISQVEARLRKVRQAREQLMREENVRAVRIAEVQTRIQDLLASIQEDFGRALQEAPVSLPDAFDEPAAREEVQDLRGKLRALGAINALALESYEEEKERLDFLSAQQQDLESAESTLLRTIGEINHTAIARFNETFDAIRANYSRIFLELFGQDAAADLSLADPGDPLESAIEIRAKPRGKRPSTIAQLSGGEKALTAIALLFAIYLVKPSPFCILDEVDAPLDDANVERFMNLIREFSEGTQFILVTHNKRTMELADRLYGITMQEQGVSRLVSVRFDEALEIAG